jgi:hypothetical protein
MSSQFHHKKKQKQKKTLKMTTEPKWAILGQTMECWPHARFGFGLNRIAQQQSDRSGKAGEVERSGLNNKKKCPVSAKYDTHSTGK